MRLSGARRADPTCIGGDAGDHQKKKSQKCIQGKIFNLLGGYPHRVGFISKWWKHRGRKFPEDKFNFQKIVYCLRRYPCLDINLNVFIYASDVERVIPACKFYLLVDRQKDTCPSLCILLGLVIMVVAFKPFQRLAHSAVMLLSRIGRCRYLK